MDFKEIFLKLCLKSLQNLYFFWPRNYISMNLPTKNNHTKGQRDLYEDVHDNKLNAHQQRIGFKYSL